MGVRQPLEHDESFVFMYEILSLVQREHQLLTHKFIKFEGEGEVKRIGQHETSRLSCRPIEKSRLYRSLHIYRC